MFATAFWHSKQTSHCNHPDPHPAQPRFVNWWTVWNMSISLVTRRQKRSKRPKISVSLKSNCLPQKSKPIQHARQSRGEQPWRWSCQGVTYFCWGVHPIPSPVQSRLWAESEASPLSGGSTPGIHRSDGCTTTGSSDGSANRRESFLPLHLRTPRKDWTWKSSKTSKEEIIMELTAKRLDEYQRILLPEEFWLFTFQNTLLRRETGSGFHLVNFETIVPILIQLDSTWFNIKQNPHPTNLDVSDLAIGDHLVGNLCEKIGHAFLGVKIWGFLQRQTTNFRVRVPPNGIFRQASVVL